MNPAEIALTLSPVQWSEEIADHLDRAKGFATRDDLKKQAVDGAASCFAIQHEGRTVGAYMLRIDRPASGPEGVIVAAAGHLDGVQLMDTVLPHIERQLVDAGCLTIRAHTSRPGIARKLGLRGYGMAEIVLFKKV